MLFGVSLAPGQDKPNTDKVEPDSRFQRLTEQMSNVKLVGNFTVAGRDNKGPLAKEEYTIRKVEKLPEGDKWMFLCRIKYGKHDLEIPLPLDVKWAENTPVITLDELTIPTLGTFSARVVLHDNKYAGTWRHDQVSGHLFGLIEKNAAGDEKAKAP
jgi:hypothetical protein